MSRHSYDVVIVGGAVTGSACAYFLMADPNFDGSVAVVEMDSTFSKAATSLSASSIRHQFSNPINVKISQFGSRFIHDFAKTMKIEGTRPDPCFRENGYLFLASSKQQEQNLLSSHETQIHCGANVVLLSADELADAFPHLNVEDIRLASFGRTGEGWLSGTELMNGFRQKAIQLGADYIHGKVSDVVRNHEKVTAVILENGQYIHCGSLVNAAGTRGVEIAATAGFELPVEPRKRTIFVFRCERSPQGTANIQNGQLPLMIDTTGTFCRPDGECFLAGMPPQADPEVSLDDFEPRYDEFEIIWQNLAARSSFFEAIKMVSCWAGHYDYNTFDQNAVIGPHTHIRNFIFANGFSGHGLQQSPAIGRAVSECIIYGEFKTLDLSELSYERILRREPFVEKAII